MYDADLTMRFWRSATEAWFNYAFAGVAAIAAWQDQSITNSQEPAPADTASSSPVWPMADMGGVADMMSWWTKAMAPYAPPQPSGNDFGAGFFQFAPKFSAKSPLSASWSNPWTDMMQTCCWTWPQASWSAFQMPMTAWLMALGLPYAVAAPTARANAASMDAAVAARESFDRMMSGFRTDSGHAMTPLMAMFPGGRL